MLKECLGLRSIFLVNSIEFWWVLDCWYMWRINNLSKVINKVEIFLVYVYMYIYVVIFVGCKVLYGVNRFEKVKNDFFCICGY